MLFTKPKTTVNEMCLEGKKRYVVLLYSFPNTTASLGIEFALINKKIR